MDLEEIYSNIIMENSRHQENKKQIENFTHKEHGFNASCGDDIEVYLKVNKGIIEDISFFGIGCAISQASANIMCNLVKNRSLEKAKDLTKTYLDMLMMKDIPEDKLFELEDALALKNIANMPSRFKCATLAWITLEKLLKENTDKNGENNESI